VTRLWISSGGMACPVGYSLKTACAAMRAGIARLEELPFLDNAGQPVTGAWVPVLPPATPHDERLDALLFQAIADCARSAKGMKPEETPLLVVTASQRRPGVTRNLDIVWLLKTLEARLGLRFSRQGSTVFTMDEVGPAVALSKCEELFRQRLASGALVCGADSLINARSLLWLEAAGRLKTERNPDGIIPGEAAACAWVTPKQLSSQASKVLGWGTGEEKATVLNDEPLRGEGLVGATRQALERAGLPLSAIDFRVSDLGGEHYAFREQVLLVSRLLRERKERFPLWHPAEFIGGTGAASGIIQWLVAGDAIHSASAPGVRTLCCSSTAWGERAAVILEGTPAPLVDAGDMELEERFAT
jgi:3-oxoacyl-[acyl-carrier-protein] synthase-1